MSEQQRPDIETMRKQILQAEMRQASPLVDADPRTAQPMEDVPFAVRVAVGAAPSPQDKIATLKQFYPDAVVRRTGGETVTRDGRPAYFPEREDILFTHPGTEERPELKGRLMRYDPAWYDPAPFLAEVGAKFGMARTLGAKDSRTPGELALDVGKDVAGTAVDAASNLVGGGAGAKIAETGAEMATNRAARNLVGKEAAAGGAGRGEVLDAMTRQGVPLEGGAPLVTQSSNVTQKFWQLLRNPKTADVTRSALDAVDKRLGQVFDESLEATGGRAANRAEVGAGVRQGLEDLQTHVMGEETQGAFRGLRNQRALENAAAGRYGSAKDLVPAENLRSELLRMRDEASAGTDKASRGLFPEDLQDILTKIEANGGQLPMDYFRRIRSWMGDNGGAHTLLPSNRAELQNLYGQATQDFETAFKAKGGDAYAAWKEGQINYADWARRRDALRDIANSKTLESTADVAARGGTDAKTALKRLDVLTDSLGRQELADLKRMKLTQLGTKGQGETAQFNMPTFLKGWENTSDEMRAWLTQDNGELRQALDDLYAVGKARGEFMGGRDPGTAGALMQQKSLGRDLWGLFTSPLTTVTDTAGAALGTLSEGAKARLMTDPKFVKWLVEGGRLQTESAVAKHIGALAGIAAAQKGKSEIAEDIRDYVTTLRNGYEPPAEANPMRPGKAADLEAMPTSKLKEIDFTAPPERGAARKPGGKR